MDEPAREHYPDVVSEHIRDNETWNTCPWCRAAWRDKKATPGVLHRTRTCKRCDGRQERSCQ